MVTGGGGTPQEGSSCTPGHTRIFKHRASTPQVRGSHTQMDRPRRCVNTVILGLTANKERLWNSLPVNVALLSSLSVVVGPGSTVLSAFHGNARYRLDLLNALNALEFSAGGRELPASPVLHVVAQPDTEQRIPGVCHPSALDAEPRLSNGSRNCRPPPSGRVKRAGSRAIDRRRKVSARDSAGRDANNRRRIDAGGRWR